MKRTISTFTAWFVLLPIMFGAVIILGVYLGLLK